MRRVAKRWGTENKGAGLPESFPAVCVVLERQLGDEQEDEGVLET